MLWIANLSIVRNKKPNSLDVIRQTVCILDGGALINVFTNRWMWSVWWWIASEKRFLIRWWILILSSQLTACENEIYRWYWNINITVFQCSYRTSCANRYRIATYWDVDHIHVEMMQVMRLFEFDRVRLSTPESNRTSPDWNQSNAVILISLKLNIDQDFFTGNSNVSHFCWCNSEEKDIFPKISLRYFESYFIEVFLGLVTELVSWM